MEAEIKRVVAERTQLRLALQVLNAIKSIEDQKTEQLHLLLAALQTDPRATDPDFVSWVFEKFAEASRNIEDLPAVRALFNHPLAGESSAGVDYTAQ
jgi:hypothetical protein